MCLCKLYSSHKCSLLDAPMQDAKDKVPDKASNDDKLALYGLFKQAMVGDNTTNKPGFLDQKGERLRNIYIYIFMRPHRSSNRLRLT